MRTLAYGLGLLVLGILAALPFRKSGFERGAADLSDSAQPGYDSSADVSAIRELSLVPQNVWSDAGASPEPIPATAFHQELPVDYGSVAVPLATPPALSARYSAIEPSQPPRTSQASNHPIGSPLFAPTGGCYGPLVGHPDAETAPNPSGTKHWPTHQELAASAPPVWQTSDNFTDRSASRPKLELSAGQQTGQGTPVSFQAATDQAEPRVNDQPQKHLDGSDADAMPQRKRHFIREPVDRS